MKTDAEIAKQFADKWLRNANLGLEQAIKQAIMKSRGGTKPSDKLPTCPWCNQVIELGEESVKRGPAIGLSGGIIRRVEVR